MVARSKRGEMVRVKVEETFSIILLNSTTKTTQKCSLVVLQFKICKHLFDNELFSCMFVETCSLDILMYLSFY